MNHEYIKTPEEVLELYWKYRTRVYQSGLYSIPFNLLAVGSVGIAIKIATGDEALSTLYANKLMAGLHVVGLVASFPGLCTLSLKDKEKLGIVKQISELEGRHEDLSITALRVGEVGLLAQGIASTGTELFFNRIHFSLDDFDRRKFHSDTLEGNSETRMLSSINRTFSDIDQEFVHKLGTSREELLRKVFEVAKYRWEKVALDHKQTLHQRRYAHHMVRRLTGLLSQETI